MRHLSIKEWGTYQHYTKRHPPWIKLHARLLDNYDFICLQDASKAHLMLLWVLASKLSNRIPYDLAFISTKIGATTAVDIEELVLQGFIEVSQDDGKTLASRTQKCGTETEAKKKPASPERYAFMGTVKPIWKAKYGGDMPKGAARDLAPINEEIGTEALARRLTNYVAATEAAFVSIPRFAQTHGSWDTAKSNGVLTLDERREKQFKQRGYV